MHYGEQAPYKNTCIALDTCAMLKEANRLLCVKQNKRFFKMD